MANKKAENDVSISQNLPNKLLSCLYSQRRTGRFCDVILNVGGIKFSVHSCVLASFSPYFNDMFMSSTSKGLYIAADRKQKKSGHTNDSLQKDILEHWSLRNPLHLTLPISESSYGRKKMDCSDCTAKVLDFMYLGKIQIQNEHVDHVKSLSTILEVSELLFICDKYKEKYESRKKRKSEVQHKPLVKKQKSQSEVEGGAHFVNNEDKKSAEEANGSRKGINEPSDSSQIINTPKVESPTILNSLNKWNENVKSVGTTAVNESKIDCTITNNDNNLITADPYMCSICELKFSSSILLRQHRETHRGRLNTCYACRYSSYKAFELIKHLLEADHQEIVCSLCLFEAETPEKLKDHLKQHNHPKPFFCSICNVRFQTRASLNTHTPKHSTEMPFSCSVCSRAFKWKQGLQNHMAVHTPEKKHLCSECGFSTAYQSTFRQHALVHTSNMFICPHAECNFKSARKQNFMSHLMTHNKEKPYQCEVCGQSYSQSKNLRRHAVKHDAVAEDFLERCPLCLYQTMRLDKLKIHFKKHHPEGDETLLNVERKKHRMPNVAIQRETRNALKTVSQTDINVPEKLKPEVLNSADSTAKHSEKLTGQTAQLTNKKENKPTQENALIVSGLQLSQEVTNGNATTFIITGVNTPLPQLVNTREVVKTSLNNVQIYPNLTNEEGAIILLDNLNTLFVPANEKCSLTPLTFNCVSDIRIPEMVPVKRSNLVQMNNSMPLEVMSTLSKTGSVNTNVQDHQLVRTETLTLNTGSNSKLLFMDDVETSQLDISNTECVVKSSKVSDSAQIQKLLSTDSFMVTLNNINDTQMQRLTAIVDGFNSDEILQPALVGPDESSVLSTTVGNLINEQLQALTSHKDDSTLDVLNNNVIQELFADEGTNADLDALSKDVVQELALNEDSTNTLDLLSKDVPQLVGNEETLNVVLHDDKDKMLLCHETITDDTDNIQHSPAEKASDEVQVSQLNVNEDSDNQVLRSFQSFESIFDSLSLPEKI